MGQLKIEEEEESFPEWKAADLKEFVQTQLRNGQVEALRVLVERDEVTRENFREEMKRKLSVEKFRGWDLGGLPAGSL